MANTPFQTDSLNLVFNKILVDLKNSSPLWEDFLCKSSKLNSAIRNVLQCSSLFWEAFQKIADLATDAQGATKEIGVSLTRLCMRQRLVESKIKNLNHHLITSLTNPVQDKMEEWKRFVYQLEKDRLKETKKAKGEWKKATGESMRLQKKAQKRGSMRGLGSLQNEVEGALKNAADKFSGLQYVESLSLRKAMTHERERFCFLFTSMKPILECQTSMLSDITSLDELMKSLTLSTCSPDCLPVESEEIIRHIVDPDYDITNKNNCNLSGNTVFSSGFGSRKSSVASLNSHQSLSSGSGPSTKAKGDEPNLRESHLSMTSSMMEPSGISGDYRVSDDESKDNGESPGDDDSDEEDIDDDEDDDDSDDEAKTPSSPSTSLWNEKINHGSDVSTKCVASRHTVSGVTAFSRPALSASVFEPINKEGHNSDASLSKMDQSKQLYPNQAIPLPVYTNLKELTNAAQRKFSMAKPTFEKETIMLVSTNIGTHYDQENPTVEHHVSQYGSKTPGIRRMTLPEVALLEKRNKEVIYTETYTQNKVREVQQQSSTLKRTVEHHYNCSQVGGTHHRSNSASDKGRLAQNNQQVSPKPTNVVERKHENYYASSLTKDSLLNELSQQINRHKSAPAYHDPSGQVHIWTDIDPDLPMPPPPSTAEEEIRLASMPIPTHTDLTLRNHSSPKGK